MSESTKTKDKYRNKYLACARMAARDNHVAAYVLLLLADMSFYTGASDLRKDVHGRRCAVRPLAWWEQALGLDKQVIRKAMVHLYKNKVIDKWQGINPYNGHKCIWIRLRGNLYDKAEEKKWNKQELLYQMALCPEGKKGKCPIKNTKKCLHNREQSCPKALDCLGKKSRTNLSNKKEKEEKTTKITVGTNTQNRKKNLEISGTFIPHRSGTFIPDLIYKNDISIDISNKKGRNKGRVRKPDFKSVYSLRSFSHAGGDINFNQEGNIVFKESNLESDSFSSLKKENKQRKVRGTEKQKIIKKKIRVIRNHPDKDSVPAEILKFPMSPKMKERQMREIRKKEYQKKGTGIASEKTGKGFGELPEVKKNLQTNARMFKPHGFEMTWKKVHSEHFDSFLPGWSPSEIGYAKAVLSVLSAYCHWDVAVLTSTLDEMFKNWDDVCDYIWAVMNDFGEHEDMEVPILPSIGFLSSNAYHGNKHVHYALDFVKSPKRALKKIHDTKVRFGRIDV